MSRKAINKLTGEEQDEVATVVVIPPTCPVCGSTKRGPFGNTQTMNTCGEIQGVFYTSVKWSRTTCLDCGQRYVVKTFE